MWTSHRQQYRVSSQTSTWEMNPWTVGLVLDVALVDELMDVNHSMDHPMESPDTLLPADPQLHARVVAHNPGVQLGK